MLPLEVNHLQHQIGSQTSKLKYLRLSYLAKRLIILAHYKPWVDPSRTYMFGTGKGLVAHISVMDPMSVQKCTDWLHIREQC